MKFFVDVYKLFFKWLFFYSIAILRYLCRTFDVADHWYPKNIEKQARIDEYLEWQHLNTRAHCTEYIRQKVNYF